MNSVKVAFWLLLVALCGVASGEQAASPAVMKLSIEAQPVDDALLEFSRQTGMQVVFDSREGKDIVARGVSGTHTPEAALRLLLQDSGLHYEYLNERTVAVRAGKSYVSTSEDGSASRRPRPAVLPMRLARADREEEQSTVSAPEVPNIRGIPEILVKGRRSTNVDIQRTEDDVQPYVVFDAETLDRSMAPDLSEFLKSRLPMNAVYTSNAQEAELAGNTSSIDLRGLGPDETLILVNGRRLPGVAELNRGGSIGQADINGIPISAVERIEVLPSTASGIYGGGATGGVVNIILKSDYRGMQLGLTHDNTFDTDSASNRLDLTAGFSLEGGRTDVLLTGSHTFGNSMVVGDRDFVARAYRLYLDNTRNDFSTASQPPLGSTTNVRLAFLDTQLRLKDPAGGASIPLNSRIASIPLGYGGVQTDGGAALGASAGSYNIELPRDVQGTGGGGLLNSPAIYSLGANIRRQFSPRLEGFLDLSWSHNEGRYLDASQTSSVTLTPFDPGNPFDNFINVKYPLPGLSFERRFTSENRVANTGLIVRLPRDWIGQAEYSWSRSRTEGEATSPILSQQGQEAIQSGELDIFRDLNVFTPDYAANGYLLPSPNNVTGPFETVYTGATGRLAGPMHALPGGPLTVSTFLEHRKSVAREAFTRSLFPDGTPLRRFYPERSESADSFSVEMMAPLFSPSNARPWMHALELQTSVRHDRYQIDGVETTALAVGPDGLPTADIMRTTTRLNSTDYTAGFRYAPSPQLALRASYGTGFLPPSVAQVTPTVNDNASIFVIDPRRGGNFEIIRNITQVSGGNPNLRPEDSRSLSVGAVLTPGVLPGLRLSVDLTEIEKVDEISFIDTQTIVDQEALFGDRIERGELTQADIDQGLTVGAITAIDVSMINFSRTTVRSYDMQVDYLLDTALGSLRAYALASYGPDYITQFQASSPRINNVGHLARIKWRGNAGLSFGRDEWLVEWNMQYYHGYFIYSAELPEDVIPIVTLPQGAPEVPAQTYHDVVARFRLDGQGGGRLAGLLADTDLQIGIRNVFNTSPPILATSVPSGGYSFFGDPRLRRYSVSLRKRF